MSGCASTQVIDGYPPPKTQLVATLDYAREAQFTNSGAVDALFINGRHVANLKQGSNVKIHLDAAQKYNICYSAPRICKGRYYEPDSGESFKAQRYCFKACYEFWVGGVESCRGFEQISCDDWDSRYKSQPTLIVNDLPYDR